jgi:hypothetical protein
VAEVAVVTFLDDIHPPAVYLNGNNSAVANTLKVNASNGYWFLAH